MSADKPNILLIMADQLVPMLTGAYGHPVVKTPHLDRFTAESVRFDAAYSPHPVCVPARACLITGLYSSRNEVFDNGAELRAEFPTVFHHLRRAGYHCAAAGKMHWIGPDQMHGLNERLTGDICDTGFGLTPDWRHPQNKAHARDYVTAGPRERSKHRAFDDEAHTAAVAWLRGYDRDAPFLLKVSYHHPHEPFHPPPDLWALYDGADIAVPVLPEDLAGHRHPMDHWNNRYHGVEKVDLTSRPAMTNLRRAYYACVTYIDRKVGELLQVLEERGWSDNTLVVFTSDHGDMLGERAMVQKRSFYEYASRIPLILRWPGRAAPGTTCAAPVSLLDLFSTFVEAAGARAPADADSRSLLPLLDGRTAAGDREVISESHGQGVQHACFMLRRGDFKYVYVHTEPAQLYNVKEDPGEWTNLAGRADYRRTEREMQARILSQFDPEDIERRALASQARRLCLLQCVNNGKGPSWPDRPGGRATGADR
ncbi:MAG: sulfatase-like hydrolase/transferase [Kiritimatiellae bacterium]|nr:sulfatase-like hydrolase/transferase [Kiritimatiellia bacterium]